MTTLPSMTGAPWGPRVGSGPVLSASPDVDRRVDERQSQVDERSERSSEAWVSCAACGMDVRADRLSQHRATQH